jgi:hypothetical protein
VKRFLHSSEASQHIWEYIAYVSLDAADRFIGETPKPRIFHS